ncbi:hypothetical protein CSOJ01_02432 [Colletotrichum sojae]|uniref:Uncharacterized protein n=1 Tax=Colletotrichum sojae TaxID=2175907 RepID=A0A8H6JQX2_9PEZI|nr:hypothetical protein CSOJ01_02432 [Colletotrichum sojae]
MLSTSDFSRQRCRRERFWKYRATAATKWPENPPSVGYRVCQEQQGTHFESPFPPPPPPLRQAWTWARTTASRVLAAQPTSPPFYSVPPVHPPALRIRREPVSLWCFRLDQGPGLLGRAVPNPSSMKRNAGRGPRAADPYLFDGFVTMTYQNGPYRRDGVQQPATYRLQPTLDADADSHPSFRVHFLGSLVVDGSVDQSRGSWAVGHGVAEHDTDRRNFRPLRS